jgi:hypothetical protein
VWPSCTGETDTTVHNGAPLALGSEWDIPDSEVSAALCEQWRDVGVEVWKCLLVLGTRLASQELSVSRAFSSLVLDCWKQANVLIEPQTGSIAVFGVGVGNADAPSLG